MRAVLVFLFIMQSINLFAAQSQDAAQTCMQMFIFQMKMDGHNKAIGKILRPFTLEQEHIHVQACFKNARLNFPHDVLKKIKKLVNQRDFSHAWALINDDMKKTLAQYYRESARVMVNAQQRALAQDSGFAKHKEFSLIEKMIASYNLTLKMLAMNPTNLKQHDETIELAILRTQ